MRDGLPACPPPFGVPPAHNLPVHPVPPPRRSRKAESGGRGGLAPTCRGIISDLAGGPGNAPARPPRTRFTDARLARRRRRLTPEMNSGNWPPSARATFSFSRVPPRPVCTRHTVQDARLARRAFHSTPRVNPAYLCPSAGLLTTSCQEHVQRHRPSAPDTLYELLDLHDGHCV